MKSVLIVGAGPAGIYAAEALSDEGVHVTVMNRDIKPGGLAEYGIYPNKYKMKDTLRKYFKGVLSRENVTYYGHVSVGKNASIQLKDLEALGYDAIVVAVGAQGTKTLGLEGEDATGVYHAKDLVYHYNGLPPYSEEEYPVGEHACVIGIGNVCLDIVHWLVCEKKIQSVTAVARRGPGEVKFTKKEVRIVSGAFDQAQVKAEIESIKDNLIEVGQKPKALEASILRFAEHPLETESETKFKLRFLLSPYKIETNEEGRVTGLVCKENRLIKKGDYMGVEPTGRVETIPCETVVFAIGDKIDDSIDLPLDPNWSGAYATVPEAWEKYPERDRYMVYDPELGTPKWGVFVVGWARNASDGLVGKARLDAVTGCDEVLSYLRNEFQGQPLVEEGKGVQAVEKLENLLSERGVAWVSWEEAQKLEAYETSIALERGLGVFRLGSDSEMMKICKSKDPV